MKTLLLDHPGEIGRHQTAEEKRAVYDIAHAICSVFGAIYTPLEFTPTRSKAHTIAILKSPVSQSGSTQNT